MAINFLDNIQLNQNQLLGARLENVTSDPGTANGGDIIFNSTSNVLKYYDGTSPFSSSGWISLTADTKLSTATAAVIGGVKLFSDTDQSVTANAVTATASRTYGVQFNSSDQMVVNVPWVDTQGMVNWVLQGDTGSNQTIGNGNIVDWTGGTGISTVAASAGVPKLTITNTKPFDSITLKATTGVDSIIANSGTVTIAAGAGITTTNDASGKVTIAATGSGSMSSFDLDGDSGTTQTIGDGNTVKIAGGTNITTLASATDTVTVNLDASPSITGLTVTGGDITLGGTGRIQGVDTVTATTDAANKAYVDASVTGGFNVKGGFNAGTGEVALTGDDLYTNTAVAKGDFYVVTVAGDFFEEAAIPLTVGDSVLCQSAAASGSVVSGDFAVIQSDTDLATASTVGIGNVNQAPAGNRAGTFVSYSSGTATVGLSITSLTNSGGPGATGMLFAINDSEGSGNNEKLSIDELAEYTSAQSRVGRQFKGTTSGQTTHTFTHSLNSFDVIVQLYDTSTKETVYASVDRTSVNVVTATTAANASLTCLIDKIG